MTDQPDLPSGFNSETYHRKSPRDVAGDESKRLFTIGLGILGALVAVVLVRAFLVARSPQTASHDGAGTPVITAGVTPAKVAPSAAGGMQVPGADPDGLGASGSGAANGQLAPATEAPDPGKLASEPAAVAPSLLATPSSPAVPSGKAPVTNAPALTAGNGNAPPALLPADPAQARAAINGTATSTADASLPPKHHHHGAVAPDVATPSALGVAAESHHGVQFGALPTAAEARKEWKRLRAKMPALLDGRTPVIQTVDHNGSTLYRLRTAGFANRKAAHSFCSKVRDAGGQCLVF